jgi:NAD(P)-dependent dehydrogenase (short-subunit alcohol dehydrogenase family)
MKKIALVTGAGRGIGKAVAQYFLQNNFKVILAEVNAQLGQQAETEFRAQGFDAHFVETDVSSVASIEATFAWVNDQFGQLNVLINNAGLSEFYDPFELDETTWDRILDTNLKGQFFCARQAAKLMKNQGGGAIVNIASTRALMSEPNSEAYAASKGGIVALTHALAASLAPHRIVVNAVLPGWIETGDYDQLSANDHAQHFSGRVGHPDDIARACWFLCQAENNFISGTQLVVDGGMTRKMIYE